MAVTDYMIVFLAAVCLSVGVTDASSAGALPEACQSMTPGHTPTENDIGPSPYGIETSQLTYKEGESITVTLKGSEGFKGFLLMALRVNAETAGPVGSFEAFDAADSSLVQDLCDGGVTHTADFSGLSQIGNKIKLKWIAPDSSVGTFNFYATFVKQKDTFWVKVAAANPIQYEEEMEMEMIDDSNCETTSRCFHNCEDGDCEDFIVKWTNDSSPVVTFELQGAVTADEGYVALGLSSDKQMTNVTIIACVADSGAPKVVTLFAASQAVPEANAGDVVDTAGASVSEHTSDDDVTSISCKFTYNNTMAKEMLNGSKWKDLGESFYAFVARGMYKDGSITKHTKLPMISTESVQFLSNTLVTTIDVSTKKGPDPEGNNGDKPKVKDDGNSAAEKGIYYALTFTLSALLCAARFYL